jgi:hypothetical protein
MNTMMPAVILTLRANIRMITVISLSIPTDTVSQRTATFHPLTRVQK